MYVVFTGLCAVLTFAVFVDFLRVMAVLTESSVQRLWWLFVLAALTLSACYCHVSFFLLTHAKNCGIGRVNIALQKNNINFH